MAKITFVALQQLTDKKTNKPLKDAKGNPVFIGQSPVGNGQYAVVELQETLSGARRNSVKTLITSKEFDLEMVAGMQKGDYFGEGEITTRVSPFPYEIDGDVVTTITTFVPEGFTFETVMAKRFKEQYAELAQKAGSVKATEGAALAED